MARFLLVLGAAALAAAQSTVTLLIPIVDQQALVGSIIDVDSAATTYAVGCGPSVSSASLPGYPDGCGLTESLTVTQGPSTWAFVYSFDGDDGSYIQDSRCKMNFEEGFGTCTVSVSQSYDGTTSEQSTTSRVSTGFEDVMVAVTITAGTDKLDASPAASSTVSSVPSTADAGTTTTTAAPTGSASTESASTQTESATPTSNAGLPMITQNAALIGMAAVVGGAMVM